MTVIKVERRAVAVIKVPGTGPSVVKVVRQGPEGPPGTGTAYPDPPDSARNWALAFVDGSHVWLELVEVGTVPAGEAGSAVAAGSEAAVEPGTAAATASVAAPAAGAEAGAQPGEALAAGEGFAVASGSGFALETGSPAASAPGASPAAGAEAPAEAGACTAFDAITAPAAGAEITAAAGAATASGTGATAAAGAEAAGETAPAFAAAPGSAVAAGAEAPISDGAASASAPGTTSAAGAETTLAAGTASASAGATTTPVLTSLSGTPQQLTAAWNPVSGATGYKLYYVRASLTGSALWSTSSNGLAKSRYDGGTWNNPFGGAWPYDAGIVVLGNVTSYTLAGMLWAEDYYVRVLAIFGGSTGDLSAAMLAAATPVSSPAAGDGATVEAGTASAAGSGASAAAGFQSATESGAAAASAAGSSSSAGTESQVETGSAAASAAGTTAAAGAGLTAEAGEATAPALAPPAPTLSPLSSDPAQLNAAWTDVSGETSYTLYCSTSSALDATTYNGAAAYPETVAYPATPTNATAFKITGIPAGTTDYNINGPLSEVTYHVRVSASNSGAESALSGTQSAAAAAAELYYEYGFEDGLTTGLLGDGSEPGPQMNIDYTGHTGSHCGYTYSAIDQSGAWATVYSFGANVASGNGSVWMYIEPDYTSNMSYRVKQGITVIATGWIIPGEWTHVTFVTSGSGTITIETQTTDWDDGLDAGRDNAAFVDDIKIPVSSL